MWVADSGISLKRVNFLTVCHPGKTTTLGYEEETQEAHLRLRRRGNFLCNFTSLWRLGVNPGESRKAQEHFFCGGDFAIASSWAFMRQHPVGPLRNTWVPVGVGKRRMMSGSILMKAQTIGSTLSMAYPIANALLFLVNSTMISSGIEWPSSGEDVPPKPPPPRPRIRDA